MNAAVFPDLVVNGEVVPHAVIAAEAQHHEAPKSKPGLAWRKAANAIAVQTLLLQEARRQGFAPTPAEIGEGLFETDEEALIRGLLENKLHIELVGEEAVFAEWSRDPSRFRAPPLWEVSHILIACDPRDKETTEKALKHANVLLETVQRSPKSFAQVAKENSDCGSKSSGGVLGQLGPGDTVPEFEAALRVLSEGETVSEPILTRHGWHIIRMDAVAQGSTLPFETVKDRIAEAMEKRAWAKAVKAYVNQLVAKADITGIDLGPIA